jgi:hypothetical protein
MKTRAVSPRASRTLTSCVAAFLVYSFGLQVHKGRATPRMSHLNTGPKYLESND